MLGGCLNPPGQIFNIENNLSHFFTQQSYKLFGDVVLSHVYYLTFTFYYNTWDWKSINLCRATYSSFFFT